MTDDLQATARAALDDRGVERSFAMADIERAGATTPSAKPSIDFTGVIAELQRRKAMDPDEQAGEGEGPGATLVLGIHVPGIDPTDPDYDPELFADNVALILNEERQRNGGYGGDVDVDLFPAPQWLTADTLAKLRAQVAGATTVAPPAPTREQVRDAVMIAWLGTPRPSTRGVDAVTDAVMALLAAGSSPPGVRSVAGEGANQPGNFTDTPNPAPNPEGCGEWVEINDRQVQCGALYADSDDLTEALWRPAYCPACLRAGTPQAEEDQRGE